MVLFKVQATQMVDMTLPTSTSQPAVCAYICVLTNSKCFFRCTGFSLHKLGRLRHPLSAPMHTHRYWRVMMCGRQRGSLLSDGCDVSPHPSKTLISPLPPSFSHSNHSALRGADCPPTHCAISMCSMNEWLSLAGPMALLQDRTHSSSAFVNLFCYCCYCVCLCL